VSSPSETTTNQKRDRRAALIDQLIVLGQIASTEPALFHQAAAAACGLGITDMKTLSILLQEGPLTAGRIAERLSLTTGAVTNVIDRLERQDFVTREPDAKDRRKVIVTVNQTKLAPTDNVYRSMGETFATLLQTYSVEELAFLVQYHQASIALTKHEIAKLATTEAKGR